MAADNNSGSDMKSKLSLGALACILFFGGCQSTLVVHDSFGNSVKGIPIKSPQVYLMTGIYKTHKTGAQCTETTFVQTLSLATGATHYVNAKGGALASTEFSLSTHAGGGLSSVALNSTPAANETLDSLTSIATDVVFPLIGINDNDASSQPSLTSSQPLNSNSETKVACDTGPSGIRMAKLEDVLEGSKK